MKYVSLLLWIFSAISIADQPENFWQLRYDERGLPLTDVQIAHRYHTLMLDTGSGEAIHLYEHDLKKLAVDPGLKVTQQSPRHLIDVSGGEHQVSVWKIDRLFISGIPFNNVEAVSFKPWGLTIGSDQPVNEVLGLGLFHNKRILMDFKHDRLQILDQLPADIGDWSSWPIKKTASGLSITASVGHSPLKLIIDTGASYSFLFPDRLPAYTLFSGCRVLEPEASNLDCRVTKITLKDDKGQIHDDFAVVANGSVTQKLDFDGLLGMKFMRGHQVIIDTPESMLYISR